MIRVTILLIFVLASSCATTSKRRPTLNMEGETTKRAPVEAPIEKSSTEEGASKKQIDLGLTGSTEGKIEIEVTADRPAVVEDAVVEDAVAGEEKPKCDPEKEKCKVDVKVAPTFDVPESKPIEETP